MSQNVEQLNGSTPPGQGSPIFTPVEQSEPAPTEDAEMSDAALAALADRVLALAVEEDLLHANNPEAETGSPEDLAWSQRVDKTTAELNGAIEELAGLSAQTDVGLVAKARALAGMKSLFEFISPLPECELVRGLAADVTRLKANRRPFGVPHPDAALLAIIAEGHVIVRETDKVTTARDDIIAAHEHTRPAPPEALFRRPEDFSHFFGFTGRKHFDTQKLWYGAPIDIDYLRTAVLNSIPPIVDPDGVLRDAVPNIRGRARRDEIVAAYDHWQAEIEDWKTGIGLDVADAAHAVGVEACWALWPKVQTTRALTFDGVQAKAHLFLQDREEIDSFEKDDSDSVPDSIALDLALMTIGKPLSQPDSQLLSLRMDLQRAYGRFDAISATLDGLESQIGQEGVAEQSLALGQAADDAYDVCCEILQRIENTPATTLAGLTVKLYGLDQLFRDEGLTAGNLGGEQATTDFRLVIQILDGLRSMCSSQAAPRTGAVVADRDPVLGLRRVELRGAAA